MRLACRQFVHYQEQLMRPSHSAFRAFFEIASFATIPYSFNTSPPYDYRGNFKTIIEMHTLALATHTSHCAFRASLKIPLQSFCFWTVFQNHHRNPLRIEHIGVGNVSHCIKMRQGNVAFATNILLCELRASFEIASLVFRKIKFAFLTFLNEYKA